MTVGPAVVAAAWPLGPGPTRRRLGRALLAFGLSGVVLVILGVALVLGTLGAVASTAASFEQQRADLVALLEPTEATLLRSAGTAENASSSLEASATSARDAAALTGQLAVAMDEMARAAQLEVLGLRPFAGLGAELSDVAERSRTLATDLETTALALDANVDDSRATATDLRDLAAELAELRVELGGDAGGPGAGDGAGSDLDDAAAAITVARIVLLGLLLWLAAPALVAVWLGWRWRKG